MSDYIAEIQAAFLRLHGCDADYVETVPVVEEFHGETIWQGDVEYFAHTGASRSNTRVRMGIHSTTESGGRRYFTVLELPPVTSPQTAVEAAIHVGD